MIQPVLADDAWDAGDMGCGELVLEPAMRMRALGAGQVLRAHRPRPRRARQDIPAWCRMTGHALVSAVHPATSFERKE